MTEIGKEIRRLRKEKDWTQTELAVYAGSSQPTVNQIESGARNPSTRTLEKIAGALGVGVADLFPKDQASLPFEGPQRRTVPDALQSYVSRQVADYGRELEDPSSPHFRDRTAATLWIDAVQRDATRWANWVLEEAPTLATLENGESLGESIRTALKVSGPLLDFHRIIRKGFRRLENAGGQTDELARIRLEQSAKRFEELSEALIA